MLEKLVDSPTYRRGGEHLHHPRPNPPRKPGQPVPFVNQSECLGETVAIPYGGVQGGAAGLEEGFCDVEGVSGCCCYAACQTARDAVDEGVVFALGVEDFGEGVVGGELDALREH